LLPRTYIDVISGRCEVELFFELDDEPELEPPGSRILFAYWLRSSAVSGLKLQAPAMTDGNVYPYYWSLLQLRREQRKKAN
jgi:hypothetical protein